MVHWYPDVEPYPYHLIWTRSPFSNIFNSKLLKFLGVTPIFSRFLRLAVVVAHRSPVEAKERTARRIVGFFGLAIRRYRKPRDGNGNGM